MWIYLQDKFVMRKDAKVSVFDHGFLYGDGLFETIRSYSGIFFRLQEHLDRLSRSAKRINLTLPPSKILEGLLSESLERNALQDATVRLTLTRGEGELGLDPDLCERPTLVITAKPFAGYPIDYYRQGVSAVIVQGLRNMAAEGDSFLKSLSFLPQVEAKMEAKRRGAFEGLFLNGAGYLSEGTVSNLFWVKEGILQTPALDVGLLDGITRRVVLELAAKEKITVQEGRFLPEPLFEAEEAFLTSTGLELAPLTEVNRRKIGPGIPGPMTTRLHHAFKEAVRRR